MAVKLVQEADDEDVLANYAPQETAHENAPEQEPVTYRVEHVSVFPTKQAVAVFTALAYVLSANLMVLLSLVGLFVLTMLHVGNTTLAIYGAFTILPSAFLAYSKRR